MLHDFESCLKAGDVGRESLGDKGLVLVRHIACHKFDLVDVLPPLCKLRNGHVLEIDDIDN